jgi:hypothetical protein
MGIIERSSTIEPTEDTTSTPRLPNSGRSGDINAVTTLVRRRRRSPTNIRQSRPPKRRGEAAELAFMNKAIAQGFSIAKPWGDSERYDFILDNGRRLWRVQVRSTEYEWHSRFKIHADIKIKGQMVPLTSRDVDIIAAYIVPRNIWYIVPIEEATTKHLWLNPGNSISDARWEEFREAWDHLRSPDVGQTFA